MKTCDKNWLFNKNWLYEEKFNEKTCFYKISKLI